MPKRRSTPRQKAAARRNLVKARAARNRSVRHFANISLPGRSVAAANRDIARGQKANRKAAAFKTAALGVMPDSKRSRGSRMGPGMVTAMARSGRLKRSTALSRSI